MIFLLILIILSFWNWDLVSDQQAILAAFCVCVAFLLIRTKRSYAIAIFMSFLAVFQWLLSAVLYYSDLNPGQRLEISQMQLKADDYFSFAIPATLMFVLGLMTVTNRGMIWHKIRERIASTGNSKRSVTLIIIGMLSSFLSPYVPLFLKLPLYFVGLFGWVGLARVVLRTNRSSAEKFWASIFTLFIVYWAFSSSMFSDLVIGFGLIALFYIFQRQFSLPRKLALISIGLVLVTSIQIAKPYLRVMRLNSGISTYEAMRTIGNSGMFNPDYIASDRFVAYSIARFNQASVITWVMKRTPRMEPHTGGSTVINAVVGSFIPRAVWPDKPVSGTALYLKYTGLEFEGASYGVSQLGEAYINFGRKWTWLFMFILGAFYAGIFKLMTNLASRRTEFLFFLPAIFLHTVKVETDINRSLGFMLRYIVFLFVLNYFLKIAFNRRLF